LNDTERQLGMIFGNRLALLLIGIKREGQTVY
jgi:hypothetical protein